LLFKLIIERLKLSLIFVMCLAPSVRNKTEVSAFMAKRIAGRDVYRTKICTNSTCYQTMWCQWLPSILL